MSHILDFTPPMPTAADSTAHLRLLATHPATPGPHTERAVDLLLARGETVSGKPYTGTPQAAMLEVLAAFGAKAGSVYADGGPTYCTWTRRHGRWLVYGPASIVRVGERVLVHPRDRAQPDAVVRIVKVGPVVGGTARIGFPATR